MPATLPIVANNIGSVSTPQDIKDLRKSSWDYHLTYGMPVIHKHRWNMFDVRSGRAIKCPYHNMPGYEADYSRCPYCFGTGILGGWADGQIAYVTFSDATQNQIRIGPQGVLLFDREPQMTAPWLPEMGNGDLIVLADFKPDSYEIIEERERYTLKEVTPVTIRGFQKQVQTVEYRVNQTAQVDRVPDFDFLYEVPLIFPYNDIPPPPPDPNLPSSGVQVSVTRDIFIVGIESTGRTSTVLGIRVFGGGTDTATIRGIRLIADPPDQGDVDVFFPLE